jgi:hypothetical protein
MKLLKRIIGIILILIPIIGFFICYGLQYGFLNFLLFLGFMIIILFFLGLGVKLLVDGLD